MLSRAAVSSRATRSRRPVGDLAESRANIEIDVIRMSRDGIAQQIEIDAALTPFEVEVDAARGSTAHGTAA